jgi:large subunit ribosomal protein L22
MKAITTNVRISPKKAQVVAQIVRGMDAKKALDMLRYMPNKPAKIIYKTLTSAVANAQHNDNQETSTLVVSTIIVTKGIVLKRGNPISRGRSHPILKRTSNISLELSAR